MPEEEEDNYNYTPLIDPNDVAAQSSEEGSYGSGVDGYDRQRYTMPKYKNPSNPFEGGEDAYATAANPIRYSSQPRQQTQTAASNKINLVADDMDFYVNKIGDVNAGLVLSNSKKGTDIFAMEQPFEYASGFDNKTGTLIKSRFHVVPAGFSSVPMEDGTTKSLSNYELSKMFKVKTVPFKGGEKDAGDFRAVVQKYQQFTEQAERLRAIYNKNIYLGPMDPDKDSADAESLENQMVQTFQFILNGAKMSGSGTSDIDTGYARSMLPQRSQYTLTHLGKNELSKLDMALEMARNKIDTMAENNGLYLLQPAGTAKPGVGKKTTRSQKN